MRRASKVDENQAEIVRGLRAIGVSVELLSRVGDDCPDLLCGLAGRNYLIELKRPLVKGTHRTDLSEGQRRWHREWRGQVAMARTLDDCLRILGILQ